MRKRVKGQTSSCFILMMVGSIWSVAHGVEGAAARRPAEVKAAFLYNFTRFVEWPEGSFASSESPLVIGVIDSEAVAEELQKILKGEKRSQRPLSFRHFKRPQDIDVCHLLYVGALEPGRIEAILKAVQGRPVLTVGETRELLQKGGTVQFVTERTISLRIHLQHAREANLTISSQLLRLAEIETSGERR